MSGCTTHFDLLVMLLATQNLTTKGLLVNCIRLRHVQYKGWFVNFELLIIKHLNHSLTALWFNSNQSIDMGLYTFTTVVLCFFILRS